MSRWPGDARKERTTFGGLSRSELMSRVRSKGNETTEIRLAKLLRKAGLNGWRRRQSLIGKPDFVWQREKLAVFVDGCFWHGHNCGRKNSSPKTNVKAWQSKIERNKTRDRRNERRLRHLGWSVIRIWECQLASQPNACIRRIRRMLSQGREMGTPHQGEAAMVHPVKPPAFSRKVEPLSQR